LSHLFALHGSGVLKSGTHLMPGLLLPLPVALALGFKWSVDSLLYRSYPLCSCTQATKRLFLLNWGFGHVADRSDRARHDLVAPPTNSARQRNPYRIFMVDAAPPIEVEADYVENKPFVMFFGSL
jgi:hypothetical protein